MTKQRKRHVQQELDYRRDKNGQRRGGKRPGAGRKPKGARPGAPHARRPYLKASYPVHIVLRVVTEIGSLRKRHIYKAFREATLTVARRELHDKPKASFRIVHISIQRTHVHLIVEADHKTALSKGMQRFQISAAKHLNAAVSIGKSRRRRGSVFPDRFHQEIITNPTQARRTLAYVLRGSTRIRSSSRFEHAQFCLWSARSRLLRQACALALPQQPSTTAERALHRHC